MPKADSLTDKEFAFQTGMIDQFPLCIKEKGLYRPHPCRGVKVPNDCLKTGFITSKRVSFQSFRAFLKKALRMCVVVMRCEGSNDYNAFYLSLCAVKSPGRIFPPHSTGPWYLSSQAKISFIMGARGRGRCPDS